MSHPCPTSASWLLSSHLFLHTKSLVQFNFYIPLEWVQNIQECFWLSQGYKTVLITSTLSYSPPNSRICQRNVSVVVIKFHSSYDLWYLEAEQKFWWPDLIFKPKTVIFRLCYGKKGSAWMILGEIRSSSAWVSVIWGGNVASTWALGCQENCKSASWARGVAENLCPDSTKTRGRIHLNKRLLNWYG